jgi:hypothetical protein
MSFDDRDSDDDITWVHLSFVPTNISHFIGITEKQTPTEESSNESELWNQALYEYFTPDVVRRTVH